MTGWCYLRAVLHLSYHLRVQWSVVAEAFRAPCLRRLTQLWTLHLNDDYDTKNLV